MRTSAALAIAASALFCGCSATPLAVSGAEPLVASDNTEDGLRRYPELRLSALPFYSVEDGPRDVVPMSKWRADLSCGVSAEFGPLVFVLAPGSPEVEFVCIPRAQVAEIQGLRSTSTAQESKWAWVERRDGVVFRIARPSTDGESIGDLYPVYVTARPERDEAVTREVWTKCRRAFGHYDDGPEREQAHARPGR